MSRWLQVATRTAVLVVTASVAVACDNSDDHHSANASIDSVGAVSEQNISPGYALIGQFCSHCHAPPEPKRHTADQWPDVIARMLDTMRRSNTSLPTMEQTESILDYLQANAQQAGM